VHGLPTGPVDAGEGAGPRCPRSISRVAGDDGSRARRPGRRHRFRSRLRRPVRGADRDPAGTQVQFDESVPLSCRDHPEREPLPPQGVNTRLGSLTQPLQQFPLRPRCRPGWPGSGGPTRSPDQAVAVATTRDEVSDRRKEAPRFETEQDPAVQRCREHLVRHPQTTSADLAAMPGALPREDPSCAAAPAIPAHGATSVRRRDKRPGEARPHRAASPGGRGTCRRGPAHWLPAPTRSVTCLRGPR
jgi:hypothetical protein